MKRNVLITRHAADCGELQERLAACGIVLRPYPVLRLVDVENDPGWSGVPDNSKAHRQNTWLVMASPRAPKRLAEQCRSHGAGWLLDLPVAAIGDGTATASTAAGLAPALVGPGTGIGLAEELNRRLKEPSTLIFACGHHRRPELPEALRGAGHRVVPLIVYRMNATPSYELPPHGPDLGAVVVTSPRAARLYVAGVGGHPLPCPHWALGPTTRDAARSLGIDCLIPPEPNLESLAEDLCRN